MPAISTSDKVLVTGANGFIGHWLIRLLLERGYSVRAAVRSADKGEAILKTVLDKLPERAKDVEYVVVPDFTVVRHFCGRSVFLADYLLRSGARVRRRGARGRRYRPHRVA